MITKEQWNEVETKLKQNYGYAHFRYQGTVITAYREFVKEGKSEIIIYFNNYCRMSWGSKVLENYNPLTALFWSKRTRALHSAKEIKQIEKNFGKRGAKQYFPRLHERLEYLLPMFSKSTVLVRQFSKIEGLELIPSNEAVIFPESWGGANDD